MPWQAGRVAVSFAPARDTIACGFGGQSLMSMRQPMTPALRAAYAACTALLAAGCAGGGLSLSGSTTSYSASNAMMPVGYSEKEIEAAHYEVRAAGSEQTPRERIEKIALARAAEIGVEQRLKFFKVASVSHGVACSKAKKGGTKTSDTPATYHPTVVLDVYYAKQPAPDFRPAAETFAQVKAEIEPDTTTPEAKAAATAQIRAECGAT